MYKQAFISSFTYAMIFFIDTLLSMFSGSAPQNPIRTHMGPIWDPYGAHMGDSGKINIYSTFRFLTHMLPNITSKTKICLNTCTVDLERHFPGLYLLVQPFNLYSSCPLLHY